MGSVWAGLSSLSCSLQLFLHRQCRSCPSTVIRNISDNATNFYSGIWKRECCLRVSDRAEWKRKFILLNGKVEEIWQRLESVNSGNKVHEKRSGLRLSAVRLITPRVVLGAISLAFFLDCWKMGNLGFQKGFFYCLFKNLGEKVISEGKHPLLVSFHYQPLD